ncbi:hypothetical protein HZA42_01620, partial [Candidatus Peregrinibacteria bacterium]|nr:hypothetical protein [Candidatus Peregrinibacteria bacterium]
MQEEEHRQSDAINSRQALVRLALFGTAFIGAVGGLGVICSNIKSQLQNLAAAFDGGLQDQAQAVYPQKFTIVAPVVLQNDKSEDAGDGVPEADVAALAKRPHGTIGEACQRLVDRETKGTDGVNVALEQFNDVFEFPNPGLHEIREK